MQRKQGEFFLRPATKHTNQRFDLFEKEKFSKMPHRLSIEKKKKNPKKLVIFIYLINKLSSRASLQ